MDLIYLTIKEAAKLLKEKKITSKELVQASLDRIKKVDPKIKAFTSVFEKEALKQAEKADKLIDAGKGTELTGIPYASKNNYASFDQPARASSRILENYKTPYTGTIIKRLEDAGAVLVGKTNCDPYGFGTSTVNSGYGPSHNPWDLDRTPGGSSGGLGAAIASGCAIFGMGEDTGGSARGPGALSGITALKPTYGLLSRYGIFAMACSFDCPGPMARSANDIDIILKHLVGKDPKDSQTIEGDTQQFISDDDYLGKVKAVGYPKDFMVGDIDDGTRKKLQEALRFFEKKGIEVKELVMPNLKYAIELYYVLVPGEISSNMALYDGMRFAQEKGGQKSYEEVYFDNKSSGFEDEVKRRIMIGTYALSRDTYQVYYEKAAKARTLVIEDFKSAFREVDFLIYPVSPITAWRLDEEMDPVKSYLLDIYTVPASCAGLPSISVPAGFDKGLPVGMQITAPYEKDAELLSFANAYQQETKHHLKHPLAVESKK